MYYYHKTLFCDNTAEPMRNDRPTTTRVRPTRQIILLSSRRRANNKLFHRRIKISCVTMIMVRTGDAKVMSIIINKARRLVIIR